MSLEVGVLEVQPSMGRPTPAVAARDVVSFDFSDAHPEGALRAPYMVGGAEYLEDELEKLQPCEIPGTGREDMTTVAEIPPGVTSARHSHPGEDFGYVIEGTIVLMVDGKPPITVRAGEVFFTERGQIHNARNIGATTARRWIPTSSIKESRASYQLLEATRMVLRFSRSVRR
jgi:quercetin dioxygenase-like cupin family protein